MGKEAKVVKERKCTLCGEPKQTDSAGMKEHFRLCVRATKAGLVLPGKVHRPSKEIILS
jgi:hypothetical protein